MTARPPTLERPAEAEGPEPPEVLFREARRRRRRRWILGVTVLVVVVTTGVVVGVGVGGPGRQSHPATTRQREAAAASVPVCRADQLSVRFVRAGVTTGNALVEFGFMNQSTHRCRMKGYPNVEMLTASGGNLPTSVRDTGSFASVTRSPVTLRRDGVAYFALYFPDATGYADLTCPTSAALALTPPGSTHAVTFRGHGAQVNPYGGSTIHLHCGEIDVSPITARKI